jgi:hypothetical protein
MADQIMDDVQNEVLDQYRKKFFQRLKKHSSQWAFREIDIAVTYYLSDQANPTELQSTELQSTEDSQDAKLLILEDQFWMPRTNFNPTQLIHHLEESWWKQRRFLKQSQQNTKQDAIIGFYGRYLSNLGYFLIIAFKDHGYFCMYRYDPQGKNMTMLYPKDEGLFYDSFATFLDYRSGWKWMLQQFRKHKEAMVREVESGLVFGIRKGEPGTDPAEREDQDLEHLFSAQDIEQFDTLEFIGSELAEQYPFDQSTYEDWLDADLVSLIKSGEIDLFVLAQSGSFIAAIEDLASMKNIKVTLLPAKTEGDDDLIKFSKGKLSLQKSFSFAFLWTIHTAHTFHQGANAIFSTFIEQLDDAQTLYERLENELKDAFILKMEDENLKIIEKKNPKSFVQFPIFEWSQLGTFDSLQATEQIRSFLGIDALTGEIKQQQHSLKKCPICGHVATIQAMIRSKNIEIKNQPYLFDLGTVQGYFSLSCPKHQVPITWEKPNVIKPQFDAQSIQFMQIRGEKVFTETDHPNLAGIQLIWGPELAGALIQKTTKEELKEMGYQGYAYAITPHMIAFLPTPPDQRLQELKRVIQYELPALENHSTAHLPLDWYVGK